MESPDMVDSEMFTYDLGKFILKLNSNLQQNYMKWMQAKSEKL